MNKAEWDSMETGWQKDMDVHRALFCPAELTERFIVEELPAYTTDRNACVLVLDEIERQGHIAICLLYWLSVSGETDVSIDGRAGTMAMWRLLHADPDTICYCALRAVEEA